MVPKDIRKARQRERTGVAVIAFVKDGLVERIGRKRRALYPRGRSEGWIWRLRSAAAFKVGKTEN